MCLMLVRWLGGASSPRQIARKTFKPLLLHCQRRLRWISVHSWRPWSQRRRYWDDVVCQPHQDPHAQGRPLSPSRVELGRNARNGSWQDLPPHCLRSIGNRSRILRWPEGRGQLFRDFLLWCAFRHLGRANVECKSKTLWFNWMSAVLIGPQ